MAEFRWHDSNGLVALRSLSLSVRTVTLLHSIDGLFPRRLERTLQKSSETRDLLEHSIASLRSQTARMFIAHSSEHSRTFK